MRAPTDETPAAGWRGGNGCRLHGHAGRGRSPRRGRRTAGRVALLGIGTAVAAATLVACRTSTRVPSIGRPPASLTAAKAASVSSDVLAGSVRGGRFIHPIVVGGLRVTAIAGRLRGAPLGLDWAEAKEYVALTGGLADGAPASGQQIVGYGRVTLTGVTTPAGTPVLHDRPAWVGVSLGRSTPVANGCPAERTSLQSASHLPSGPDTKTVHPIDSVVVFYGMGGRGAVLYRTGGSKPCGGTAGPNATIADAEVPVPWAPIGPPGLVTPISYQAPACARLFSVAASGNVRVGIFSVAVTVAFPFDRTGCGTVKRFVTAVTVFPPHPGPGAPPPPSRVELQPVPMATSIPRDLVGPIAG